MLLCYRSLGIGVVNVSARTGGILAPLVILLVSECACLLEVCSSPPPSPGSVLVRTIHVGNGHTSSSYRRALLFFTRNNQHKSPSNSRGSRIIISINLIYFYM